MGTTPHFSASLKRIAIWNTAFLGGAVLTLPLIRAVRNLFPDAAIDFYVRQGFAGLFEDHPDLAAVFAMDRKSRSLSGLPALGRQLSARGYDLWVCAHPSFRSALISRLSGAPCRVGYNETGLPRLFFTCPVPRCFAERDEIERLLQLAVPLGFSLDLPQGFSREGGQGAGQPAPEMVERHWPHLVLPAQAREKAARFYAGLAAAGEEDFRGGRVGAQVLAGEDSGSRKGGGLPVLGVHPGSVWPTKRWPVEFFAEIGARALRGGAHVLVFAGPGEEGVARQMIEAIEASGAGLARLHDCSGRLNLAELGAFIGGLSCYVTNDSGPMHLAWAQRVPVTALFGPTTRQLGFFPRGSGATVMERPFDCRPCGLHGHRECPEGHHNCMRELAPEGVWADVAGKLWPV